MPTPDAPTLPGFLDEHARGTDLRVWCTWCCHWHIHGPESAGSRVHRIAHCYAPDSAYKRDGYWIEVSSTPWRDVATTVRRATHSQQRSICVGRISDAVKRLRAQAPPAPKENQS